MRYRRAPWHDYKSRCIYHITITKSPEIDTLGLVVGNINAPFGDPQYPQTVSSIIGKKIFYNIKSIPKLHENISLLQYAIMPDHIHLLIFVEKEIPEHIGFYISRFKYFTKLELQRKNFIGINDSLFEPSFHDRILQPKHNLQTVIDYIRENPKRYLQIKENPDSFRKAEMNLYGKDCQIYGNILLLNNPFKEAVVIHRADTPDIIDKKKERWMHLVENGGVIVGAFVSCREKEILNEIIEIGGKVIIIRDKLVPEKEKPSGKLFHHCAKGKLLMIYPYDMAKFTDFSNPDKLTRSGCLFRNSFAEIISNGEGR